MYLLKSVILVLLLNPFQFVNTDNTSKENITENNVRVIEVEGNDQMKFDVTEITATTGEQIIIELSTKSSLPKVAMAHNMVILKPETDVKAFASASAVAKANNYIAPQFEDQVLAATALAGGGETVKLTLNVPENAGEYTYICSFPGHYAAGMTGTLLVKEPNT